VGQFAVAVGDRQGGGKFPIYVPRPDSYRGLGRRGRVAPLSVG
jgi:hypothetical protein